MPFKPLTSYQILRLKQIEYEDSMKPKHHKCPNCGVWHQRVRECPCCGWVQKVEKEEK